MLIRSWLFFDVLGKVFFFLSEYFVLKLESEWHWNGTAENSLVSEVVLPFVSVMIF